MKGKKWTEEELQLIEQDIPIKELMERTGRSYLSIASKKTKLRHPPVKEVRVEKKGRPTSFEFGLNIPPCNLLTQREKENRLYFLADMLHIKLYKGEGVYYGAKQR